MLATMVLLRQINKVYRAASCFVAIRRIFNPAQIVSSSSLLEAPPFSKARETRGDQGSHRRTHCYRIYLVDFPLYCTVPDPALQDGRFIMEVRLKIQETKEKEPHWHFDWVQEMWNWNQQEGKNSQRETSRIQTTRRLKLVLLNSKYK